MTKALEAIYNHCPSFIQNIGISLYGLDRYFREYGNDFRKKLDEFEQQEWFSKEQLEEYQSLKLNRLIQHCYANVPYYRRVMNERGLKPRDIQTISELSKLPLLTRDDIRADFDQLIATNVRRGDLRIGHTSGTTGSPLEFLYDREICLIKNVVDWRQKRWAGINPGDKIAFFLGRVVVPIERNKPPFWRTNWVLNHRFFSSFHMSEEHIDKYIEHLRKYAPVAVEGYPSTISIIAGFLLSRGKALPLKAVFTSSETLHPQQRESIEAAFQCPLYDFYGVAERVVFATECTAHEGHHLNMDFGITEVINAAGNPARAGEMGRIVATGLHNYGMPLLRYRTDDVTGLKQHACSCGRAFSLMDDVTTKAEDVLTTRDGRLISSSILTHVFKPMHNVAESQIVQTDKNNVIIKIVRRPNYDERDSQHLLDGLGERLGVDMNFKIEFVNDIPRTKAGKFRWVISHVPLEF